jgi:hypothetical protein
MYPGANSVYAGPAPSSSCSALESTSALLQSGQPRKAGCPELRGDLDPVEPGSQLSVGEDRLGTPGGLVVAPEVDRQLEDEDPCHGPDRTGPLPLRVGSPDRG